MLIACTFICISQKRAAKSWPRLHDNICAADICDGHFSATGFRINIGDATFDLNVENTRVFFLRTIAQRFTGSIDIFFCL